MITATTLTLLASALVLPPVVAKTERLFISFNGHLVDTRLDPLMNPGTCSRHVHSVFGSASFGASIDASDLTDRNWQDDRGKEEQTTSNIIPNLSMYWAPAMYIRNPDDNLLYIVPTFSRTYYRIEHKKDISVVNPFPYFLQMIAGDFNRDREWRRNDGEDRDDIRWTMRSNRRETNYVDHGDWSYLRDDPELVAEEDQLEMNVRFPNCLRVRGRRNRPVTTSPDFRSHAAYTRNNVCPDGFPYHIPTVNLEVRYDLHAMRNQLGRNVVNNMDNWVLSTGDTSGASAHADFVSGWPEDLMENAIQRCRNNVDPDGRDRCYLEQYFDQSTGQMTAKQVPFRSVIPDEVISPVESLPSGPCPELV